MDEPLRGSAARGRRFPPPPPARPDAAAPPAGDRLPQARVRRESPALAPRPPGGGSGGPRRRGAGAPPPPDAGRAARGPDPKRFDGRVYTSLPFLADERGLVPPRETRRPSHLYVVPVDGGDPRQLTSGTLSQTEPDWSPDGSAVIYAEDPTDTIEVSRQAQPQLWIVPLAGGPARHVETGYVESRVPAWSPDGRTIAFICSNGRGLENDVCVIPTAGGATRNLTSEWPLDPIQPNWSTDGKTIFLR